MKSIALFAGSILAAPAADLVPELKGAGPNGTDQLDFTLYSGYVQLPSSTKNLHYMFAPSDNRPEFDPLIVWFNGGPGCSSMMGFAQEIGPVVWKDGATGFVRN